MNDKKICFICCVNDEELYNKSLFCINNLEIPDGYEIENICIKNTEYIAKSYNEAMKKTDAKYKVYLHQDVFIINKYFIKNVIDLFNNKKIGMVGVIGSKVIPINGIWWKSKHMVGKFIVKFKDEERLVQFKKVENEYENVKCIDGLIIITQYDVPWREDIFKGWYFYDTSQSIEFKKNGYEVVIPKQDKPWCINEWENSNDDKEYEKYRNVFLKEYSKEIFPLVSILIPSYNRPHYLEIALNSALNQTYKNTEIIICDDSTNNQVEHMIKKSYKNKYENLKYYKNEKNLGQFENDLKLLELANGEYINFLMDDDVFVLSKIEKMMGYYIEDIKKEIKLVTSYRELIDKNGQRRPNRRIRLFNRDTIEDGIYLGNIMLRDANNFIGEPTTVIFRKEDLLEPFGVFNKRKYGCNVDQATWLNLLCQGKVVYISEPLSYFRVHDNQQLNSERMKLLGAVDYTHEILTSPQKGFLKERGEYMIAANRCLEYATNFVKILNYKYIDENKFNELKDNYNILKSSLL